MRSFYLLLIIALFAGVPLKASAENPTRDKCTCNLDPDDPPKDGAWVKNASACWSTEVRQRNWCDIVVESLQRPQSNTATTGELLAAVKKPPELVEALRGRFIFFAEVASVGGVVDLRSSIDIVASRFKANEALLSACVSALAEKRGGFVRDGANGVVCRVSSASGWLRLEVPIDDFRIVYMVAPPQ